jgi:hypothetical protein
MGNSIVYINFFLNSLLDLQNQFILSYFLFWISFRTFISSVLLYISQYAIFAITWESGMKGLGTFFLIYGQLNKYLLTMQIIV